MDETRTFNSKRKVVFDIKNWIISVAVYTGSSIVSLIILKIFVQKLYGYRVLGACIIAIPLFIMSILSCIYIRVDGTENEYYQILED